MARRRLTRVESKALTRARLVASARKVFLERGFHAAPIGEIAEDAGYTIGALYSNFDGKSELFVAVFEEYVANRAKEIGDAVDAAAGRPEEQTREAAVQWMERLAAEPEWFPLFIEFWAHAVHDPKVRRELAVPLGAVRVVIGQMVERHARERGIQLPLPAQHIGTAIKALGNGIALEKIADPDGVPDELFGAFLTIFLHGLEAAGKPQPDKAGAEATGGA